MGPPAVICSVNSLVIAIRPSGPSTTRLTSPMDSASLASTMRPVRSMSRAQAGPTSRDNLWVPPSRGSIPPARSGKPKRAVETQIRRSPARANSRPVPTASPFSATSTGVFNAATADATPRDWPVSSCCSGAPAENTSPLAVSTTRRRSESWASRPQTSLRDTATPASSRLPELGRSKVTVATCWARFSSTGSLAIRAPFLGVIWRVLGPELNP